MTPRHLLTFGLIAYLMLCIAYISATPYRTSGHLLSRMQSVRQGDIGAPDERQHVNYIRDIAQTLLFPVFRPGSADLYETYQSHQPPLYYLLCTPVEWLVGANESAEKWGLRLVNVLIGLLTMIGIYTGIRRFTGNEMVAAFASTFTSLLPMFIAISSAVTNDMLLYLAAVAVMNVIALGWERGWSLSRAVLMGVVLGLALLTKTTSLVLFPMALCGMLLWKDKRATFGQVFVVLFLAILIASPWLIRNQTLYGDPLAMRAFREASVGNLAASEAIAQNGFLGYWTAVWQLALYSFWGVFAYFDIFMPEWIYWLLTVIAGVCVLARIWRLVRGVAENEKRFHILNVILSICVVAAFVAYNSNYFQAQARYLYPAIFAIASGVAFGLWTLTRNNERNYVRACSGVLVLLFAVNVYVTWWLLPIGFAVATKS